MATCYHYSQISSPATRDLFLDLTGALEDEELLSGPQTGTSSLPGLLTISNVTINTEEYIENGIVTQIGKGVHFSVATLQESQATVDMVFHYAGDAGTSGSYLTDIDVVINQTK